MKTAADPLDYAARLPMRLWASAVLVFLYAPLALLVAFSFNAGKRSAHWAGFSLDWYRKLFSDAELLLAFGNSLTIALIATAVSLVLGTLMAIALWRFRFPGKTVLQGALALPILVPEICLGVAMMAFFTKVMPWPADLPWPLNLGAITIAHVSFCFPFVVVLARARLATMNIELLEAARDLGANEFRIVMDVMLPHLRPALLAGALLTFTLSLDDFVITFFTAGPNTVTFPIIIYGMVRFSVTPELNAASTLLLVITIALTALALLLQRRDNSLAALAHG